MAPRTIRTSHKAIFEYWKNKWITEDGQVVDGSDANYLNDIPVIEDWGEPECFACRYCFFDEDDLLEEPEDDPAKMWTDKKLHDAQRAHIIPHALGGKDAPENLFLLCPTCHAESPDTAFPSEFFRWVYRTRKGPSAQVEAYNECVRRDILPLFYAEDVEKFAGSHGAVYSRSSVVSALVGAAEKRYKENPELKDKWEKLKSISNGFQE